MSGDDFFAEIQAEFLQEASDLLQRVEALSLGLEKNPQDNSIYDELARLAHNFKGSGKAVGFEHISKLGHRIEDYILAIRHLKLPVSGSNLDFLFKCLDRLKLDIDLLIVDKSATLDHAELFAEIASRLSGAPQEIAQSPVREDFVPSAEPTTEAVEAPPEDKPSAVKAPVRKEKQSEVLRIPKSKIDFLLESFGEQVILQSTLDQYKYDLESNKEIVGRAISQLTKLTFELQSHALALTMVQLAPLFTKLERAIRDAARMCDKKVNVTLIGAETEVDKTLIDALSDGLTHMVRNSVDHAIESTDDRLAVGKPETGQIVIQARRVGGQLWFEVQDDGKGLSAELIQAKAIEKGLILNDVAERMSDHEAYKLIFLNGFSTKSEASELSGRGVGMNVVQEAVEGLKGQIEIDSALGKGTTFRLKLPLSLSIFNGAVISVSGNRFVVPSSDISEVSRIDLSNVVSLDKNKRAIRIREEIFEFIDLREKLNGSKDQMPGSRRKNVSPILLSRKSGNKAYLVDEILGMQKIVQKLIGDEVKGRPGYVAGTILSDGSPGVILSLNSIA